jgi:hypothetical protein
MNISVKGGYWNIPHVHSRLVFYLFRLIIKDIWIFTKNVNHQVCESAIR